MGTVVRWVRTTVQSVGGLGLVMNKYGGGGDRYRQ